MLRRQNVNTQINSRLTPATNLKKGTFVSLSNFTTQKGNSKQLQPPRKGPYQIIEKLTDVTFNLKDTNRKEIIQQRNSQYHLPKRICTP